MTDRERSDVLAGVDVPDGKGEPVPQQPEPPLKCHADSVDDAGMSGERVSVDAGAFVASARMERP
jgi:hypothetical protein